MKEKKRMPLLRDHHNHPSIYSAMSDCLDLRSIADKRTALETIRERHEEIVFVLGWNNSLYSFGEEDLASLPPVFIINISLHAFLVNDAAREKLAATHPDVAKNIDDAQWTEKNLPTILKLISDIRGCGANRISDFYDELLRVGVWYAEEMLLPGKAVVQAYRDANLLDRTAFWAEPPTYLSLDEATKRIVKGIKLFTDGALGARTAAMQDPFRSGEKGLLLYADFELQQLLSQVSDLGKPLAIHAIGDRALEQVMTALEVLERDGCRLPGTRIEHCQFISRENAERAKRLAITLSMQPNFNSDSSDYRDRLSKEQCSRNNPFRMLIDDVGFTPGEDLILGSDGMPHGVEFALQMSLFPPYPSQRLTVDEFIRGYCMPDLAKGQIEIDIDWQQETVAIAAIEIPK